MYVISTHGKYNYYHGSIAEQSVKAIVQNPIQHSLILFHEPCSQDFI
jgi:hypothetical protein